jgi:hypothetical protein
MVLDGLEQWGGVPVASQGAYPNPILGDHYFVDGTNGSDDHGGKSKTDAKQTIQAALTLQIAKTTSFGDVIWVLPGTYAESLTGNMTKVQIIGVGKVGTRPLARIHPTTSYAYTGEMLDSGLANLELFSQSIVGTRDAAVLITTNTSTLMAMHNSYIDRCFFSGGVDNNVGADTLGIVVGAIEAANTDYEFMESAVISNNIFGAVGGRYKEFTVGISVMAHDTSQGGAEYKGMTGCIISGNIISAHLNGIKISCGALSCPNSSIIGNIIGSTQSAWGPQNYGVQFYSAAADQLCMVVGNHINGHVAAIYNGSSTGGVLDNWGASNGTEVLQGAIAT